MDLGDVESSLKILLAGKSGVGKTSFSTVFCGRELPVQHKKTIGTAFKEKDVELDTGDEVNLMLWEIGGDHTMVSSHNRHFKEADGVILMFATDDRDSFEKIQELKQKITQECRPGTLVLLVQNKVDLLDSAAMSPEEVEQLARDLRVKLYRISCSDKVIVEQVFQYMTSKLIASGLGGSTLADIGDVQPTIDDAEAISPQPLQQESSSSSLNNDKKIDIKQDEQEERKVDHEKYDDQVTTNYGKSSPNSLLEPKSSNQALIFPRHNHDDSNATQSSGPPTVPSKQRTLNQKRKSCKIM